MTNVAILGLGVVGGGVYEVIKQNGDDFSEKLNIKYVLDKRSFLGHELADRVICDYNKIICDPTISVVVETMGGASPAFEFSRDAILAKKSVVTSNKLVVEKHGAELEALAAKNGVSYLYEAAVGGGIPLIHPLENCFKSNKIKKILGILNGTTNFILYKM
ncbi:MAG: homoserine dehydrogenase, partial [Clostridia bacterium]